MGRIVGIDLGTTNSCVAFLDGDQPVVIPDSEGSRTTPSVVAIATAGERLVGQLAKRQAVTNPRNTVTAVKRLIGRKLDDPRIAQHRESIAFDVEAADNGDCRIVIGGQAFSPPEMSAMVLARMKETAEDFLGEKVEQAVVTVPAYFDDAQRQATKDAGRIAGLDVVRILNEPTAAALAYGHERKDAERAVIAVYDLGGGTFDISILEVAGGVFQVRATSGDTYLGGEDFDRRVIEFLVGEFQRQNGADLDPRADKMALQRLKEAAERAKQELSSSLTTDVNLPFLFADPSGQPRHLVAVLSRAQLETITADLIDRTLEPCKQAIADAGLEPGQIDQVILVGGQTRMPRVRQLVEKFFARKPSQRVNPDEVVAVGAAIQGGILLGQVDDYVLLDVTPLSLGVETAGGVATKIIPRNTTIPTRKGQVFSTAVDNQPYVEVHVLQGERAMAADCKPLARFQLLGIAPAPRGVPEIRVEFDIDANGIVSVAARDLKTGREQSVKVMPSSGLSEAEIARIVSEASAQKDVDSDRRELAELSLEIEGLLYGLERALEGAAKVLSSAEIRAVTASVNDARKILGAQVLSAELLRRSKTALDAAASRIAEALLASAGE